MSKEYGRAYTVFLSAAEPSADAHCAALIRALHKEPFGRRQSGCDIEFIGVGGPKMAAADCKLLEDTVSKAAMIYKVFGQLGRYYKLINRITGFLKNNKPDLVIVCDSPAFNFHIAKAAKKAGIKTLFYVAPQLWAWAGWRIRKLRKYCDKLCCILPFEQDWFRQKGIDSVFVGNPLLDELNHSLAHYRKEYTDFEPKNAVIALMPGSRVAEINSLWGPMQTIAVRLKQKYSGAAFTTVALDAEKQQVLKATEIHGFSCSYTLGSIGDAAGKADLAIVASGSATLQAAAAGCPMVIMYQSSRILWHLIGRWLLKTKYLSLVNILADKDLVPEFMPYFGSVEPIVESIEQLLEDKDKLVQLSAQLIELAEPLAKEKACEAVAAIAIEMLTNDRPS
jgi:lipid-A-disaccharide synthase